MAAFIISDAPVKRIGAMDANSILPCIRGPDRPYRTERVRNGKAVVREIVKPETWEWSHVC
jgi:hypothetical protein